MHVVIVDGDVSYPPTSGKRLRTLNLMVRLARRHRLTYIGRADAASAEAQQATAFLRGQGIETILVDHPVPRKAGLAFYARLVGNLLSPLPYSVASHQSGPMAKTIQDYAGKHAVDLWQCEWQGYLKMLPSPARTVINAHNVDTLIWRRYYETARHPLKRFYLKNQWRKMERFEQWAFRLATYVVAVSPDDARLIREQFAMERVDVVDNGIDRTYFEQAQGQRDGKQILFLGALDWRPNLDGLELLLDKIFPMVRAQEPAARLCLVGRHPPAALAARVRQMEGVELHADVADVRPFLATSTVMAVPLRIGGGSRLKILEALACGLPVVSTPVGAEGLCLEPGRDFILADEDAMAAALVQVLRQSDAALAQAQHGRQVVLQRYDWDVLADKLEQVWTKCLRF